LLVFDSFATIERAREFAQHVETTFGHKALVFDSAAEAQKEAWYLFPLVPPIVLVERDEDYSDEEAIEASVAPFGGTFEGT
jgi:hypothetical protein